MVRLFLCLSATSLTCYSARNYQNAGSLSTDIETGGYLFQLHFTNSPGMMEHQFVTETIGNVFDGSRYFTMSDTRKISPLAKPHAKSGPLPR